MCPPTALESLESSTTSPPSNILSIVPPTTLSQSAFTHAASILHLSILAHSIRLYIYTKSLAATQNSIYHTNPAKHDLLFVACLFHDIGTTETYNGPQRFEVEGADAAVAHLSRFDVGEEDKMQVWYTIALHTCNGIVQRMGELPALMRRALCVEFSIADWENEKGIDDVVGFKARLDETYPRMMIEKVLGVAVALQAVGRPEKAPFATWPGGLYRSYMEDPGWEGVNKAF